MGNSNSFMGGTLGGKTTQTVPNEQLPKAPVETRYFKVKLPCDAGTDFDWEVDGYVENRAHLADQPGLRAAGWPRMAEAWGCPRPESATAGAASRRAWPKCRGAALFST